MLPCEEMQHRPGQGLSQRFPWQCRGISVCHQKALCVSTRLLPAAAAAREKPELTPQCQGSALVLIDHSVRGCLCADLSH